MLRPFAKIQTIMNTDTKNLQALKDVLAHLDAQDLAQARAKLQAVITDIEAASKTTPALLPMEWAERYAREAAFAFGSGGAHSYLPKTAMEANRWQPHQWVCEAIRTAFNHGQRKRATTGFLVLPRPPEDFDATVQA